VESHRILTREGDVTANPSPEVAGPLDRDVGSHGDALSVVVTRDHEVHRRDVERVGEREEFGDVESALALLDLPDSRMVDADAERLHAGREVPLTEAPRLAQRSDAFADDLVRILHDCSVVWESSDTVSEWLQSRKDAATLPEDAERMRVAMDQTERLAYTVTEAAALLGIGRTHAYALAKAGDLPTVTLGRRVVVPKARLDAMLAGERP